MFEQKEKLFYEERDSEANEYVRNVKPKTTVYAGGFKLVVEDIFNITGRGNVLTGTVENASVSLGDNVDVFCENGKLIEGSVAVIGIEYLRELVKKAYPGDHVSILLRLGSPELVHKDCYLLKASGELAPRQQYMAKGVCAHCGGSFKGIFSKKCSVCGKPKDY